ncbi:MAG: glycoside hydrolase family 3 N-terminal domain-containing protein [Phycisphaerales bacterium JB065]
MTDSLVRSCGGLLMVGIRGAEPGDAQLERDLERCRLAGVRSIVVFDRDLASGGSPRSRNIVSPEQVRRLTDRVRAVLGEGVRIAVDQEGGRVARLNETNDHERGVSPLDFGALDEQNQARAAMLQAEQLKRAGIDWNLAPGVDLQFPGSGSLIEQHARSYGTDPDTVIRCARVVVDAHRDAGILSCLKHFPGHGSAPGDTHDQLLDITGCHTERELEPFRELLSRRDASASLALMTAHLLHKAIDPDRPVSLSASWTRVIRDRFGFDGVIVTDALDMGAIAKRYPPMEAILAATDAGADLLLLANNMPDRSAELDPLEAARAIARAVHSGSIEGGEARIRKSLERIARFFTR